MMAKWTEIVKTGEIKFTIEFEDGSKLEHVLEQHKLLSPKEIDKEALEWFKMVFGVKDWYWAYVEGGDSDGRSE
jgi:hypothetical protein